MSGDYANQWLKAGEQVRLLEARCAELEAERNEYAERLQWLRDLREREGSWGKPYEQAMAATDPRGGEPYECEEERDRLQERCARLQQALAVCGEHLEDCCRSDIDWRAQNESHDAAVRALAGPDAQTSGSGSSAADPSAGERQGRQPDPGEVVGLLVELARWSRVAELDGDLHARIASALAGTDTPADSQEAMPAACPRCGCLTYKLVNNSLHFDAPDGAVICDNCGKGWVHSTDEHGLITPADSQEDKT